MSGPVDPVDAGTQTGEASGPVHRFEHDAMGTTFEVIALGKDTDYAEDAAAAAFDEVDRLELELSRFMASSDVSQIAALKPGGRARVGIAAFEALKLAEEVHAGTGGAFDVTIGALFSCWFSEDGSPRTPSEDEIASATRRTIRSASLRKASGSTSAASARATRSTGWRSSSGTGASTRPSSTAGTARWWRSARPPTGRGGRSASATRRATRRAAPWRSARTICRAGARSAGRARSWDRDLRNRSARYDRSPRNPSGLALLRNWNRRSAAARAEPLPTAEGLQTLRS